MMRPQVIRDAEAKMGEAIEARSIAFKALTDSTLTDEQADKIIDEHNMILVEAGMPSTGLIVHRAAYKVGAA